MRAYAAPTALAAGAGALRLLTLSSLFPSCARPRHGIFVETRLRHLVEDYGVDARVVSPVPWFPSRAPVFGRYAALAATPREEMRIDGRITVAYPRYLMLPRIGVARQPERVAAAAARIVDGWQQSGWRPSLIDAHYLYPDGVAAALLARRLGLPYLVTARGTDVNVLAHLPGPGRRIRAALDGAAAIVTVSESLRQSLIALGIAAARVNTLRNGVDLRLFVAHPRDAARRRLGLSEDVPWLAWVGNLVAEKDPELAVRTLQALPRHRLAIVGEGPLHAPLRARIDALGLAARVRMLPAMPQSELAWLYSAADALLLTSQREGWPNVVLEALACGVPVVAVDVGAVREILGDSCAGRIAAERSAAVLSNAVRELAECAVDRAAVRRHAADFDWRSISLGQIELFEAALARGPDGRRVSA
jgi:glycosyltransferase involved in cell wall biosynthesis